MEGGGDGSGQKTSAKEIEHRRMVKALAQGLVKDRTLCSAYGYCKSTHSEFLRSSLERTMKKDPALVDVTKGEME